MIYNRPDLTRLVFEKIKLVKPSNLYIAADGPKIDDLVDKDLCDKSRMIVNNITWDCDVETLFRKTNLGCKKGVSTAISWFFQNVEEGIILEDDCMPDISFFQYCGELLQKYKNENRIMTISGNNFLNKKINIQNSYLFSRYNLTWGWATWRRAWNLYDIDMVEWKDLRETNWLYELLEDEIAVNNRKKIFDMMASGQVDTWDYAWTYTTWLYNGLCILPKTNLVSNIGFRPDATHTKNEKDIFANFPVSNMDFPLNHNPNILNDNEIDKTIFSSFFQSSANSSNSDRFKSRLKKKIKDLFTNTL